MYTHIFIQCWVWNPGPHVSSVTGSVLLSYNPGPSPIPYSFIFFKVDLYKMQKS